MAQSYSDTIQANKDVKTAKVINPNYDVQVAQQNYARDQAEKKAKADAVQKYISDKQAEGYTLNLDGSLTKKLGYTTTTIKIDKDSLKVDIQSVTETPPVKQATSEYDQLRKKIRKYENTLRDIDSGRTQASDNARNSLQRQLNYLYEAMDNLQNTGSAFYTVTTPATTTQTNDTVVFDSKGFGYSVAPALQKDFLAQKEASYQQVALNLPKQSLSSGFTVPRTVSSQETVAVPLSVDLSNVAPIKTQTFAGTIQASRPGDFATRYDDQGNRLTPTPTDVFEMKVLDILPATALPLLTKPVKNVVEGALLPARVGETLFMASSFNENELNRQATQQNLLNSGKEIVKDPFGRLVSDPIMEVVEDPAKIFKVGTEVLILEGASRGVSAVSKELGAVNKFTSADVRASAYPLSRESEQISVFLDQNKISPATSGGPEFTPIRQLTVDVGPFNPNQKYFGNPELDVPVDRQFTLAGTEKLPPKNPPGILPLDEKTISPFESNKLTIEQIGKKPLIDATSTAQSRMIDLPVQKGFNKDTIMGDKIIDLNNPDASAILSDESVQSSLGKFGIKNPIADSTSSVPKGSQKPLIFEKQVVESKPVIDNSFAFESSGPAVAVAESGSSKLDFPSRSLTGPDKKLVLNPDYVYDQASESYVKKVGDVELNLDIKGKVTPSLKMSPVSILSGASSQSKSPVISQDLNVDQKNILQLDSSPAQKVDLGKASDQGSTSKIVVLQLQSQSQVQDQIQVQRSESQSAIQFKQVKESVQKPASFSEINRSTDVIKPVLPKISSNKQVRSGSGRFSVLVKKKGKFEVLGSGYSDLATAFNRGKQEIKNTARASFKIVSDYDVPQKVNIASDKTLRPSKVDSNVVVQKAQFRISSPGEKQEISRKGVFTQKARRSLNKKTKGIFG